jgi:hypothetical protein
MSSFKKERTKPNLKSVNKKRYEIQCTPFDKENVFIFNKLNISVCVHCANLEIFNDLISYIKNFEHFEWNRLQIIINIDVDLVDKKLILKIIKDNLIESNCIIIESKNKGLDIGGFLRCLKHVKDDDHIIAKIHTKGRIKWRTDMMKIFTIEGIYNSVKLLHYENIGMIGNNNQLWDFYKNVNMSYKSHINRICNNLNMRYDESNLHNGFLIGGTIFMCKKIILEDMIKKKEHLYQYCNETDDYYKTPNAFRFELTMERFFGYLVYHYKKHIVGLISN